MARGGRYHGRRAAGRPERAADRGPSYEAAPSRNEQVLFVISVIGLLAALAAVVIWAIHT